MKEYTTSEVKRRLGVSQKTSMVDVKSNRFRKIARNRWVDTKEKCGYDHSAFQDKDACCPNCGRPFNDDF